MGTILFPYINLFVREVQSQGAACGAAPFYFSRTQGMAQEVHVSYRGPSLAFISFWLAALREVPSLACRVSHDRVRARDESTVQPSLGQGYGWGSSLSTPRVMPL